MSESKTVDIHNGRFVCPGCGSWAMLFNKDSAPNNYCGRCGTKLNWFDKDHKPIYELKL